MFDFTVIIPARYSSSRLPGKPLLKIGDKALVHHVVDRAKQSSAKRVIVATDDARIKDYVDTHCENTEVVMTSVDHENGTARIAQAIDELNLPDDMLLVNIQGDEPFISPDAIQCVAEALHRDTQAKIATLKERLHDTDSFNDINVAKVLTDKNDYALYFSRSCIPNIARAPSDIDAAVYKHIGIYGYRVSYVKHYASLAKTPLEMIESLEQLRALYHGDKIVVKEITMDVSIGVDTPQDLAKANEWWLANQQN